MRFAGTVRLVGRCVAAAEPRCGDRPALTACALHNPITGLSGGRSFERGHHLARWGWPSQHRASALPGSIASQLLASPEFRITDRPLAVVVAGHEPIASLAAQLVTCFRLPSQRLGQSPRLHAAEATESASLGWCRTWVRIAHCLIMPGTMPRRCRASYPVVYGGATGALR